MTLLLTKDHDRWEIAAVHNTLTGGPGYTFNQQPPK